jgi:hypothetical protein
MRVDGRARRLTVAGTSPHGWFQETFDVARGLDLSTATTTLHGGELAFIFPYASKRSLTFGAHKQSITQHPHLRPSQLADCGRASRPSRQPSSAKQRGGTQTCGVGGGGDRYKGYGGAGPMTSAFSYM